MTVGIDGDVLFSVTDLDVGDYGEYTKVNLDVSAYADGNPHELHFNAYVTDDSLTNTNFFVDDVALVVLPGDPMPAVVTITFDVDVDVPGASTICNLADLDWSDDYTSDEHCVEIPLRYGVTVEPPTDARGGDLGTTVTYTLRVTNTGSFADAFDIAVSGNAWTTSAPASVGPLAANAGADVQISVDIPAGASGSDSDTVTITAASQGDPLTSDSSTLTTTANPVYGVELTPAMANDRGVPGATVTYNLTLRNTGNAPDTFDLSFGDLNGWTTGVTPALVSLSPDGTAQVACTVDIPPGANDGDFDVSGVTATSQGDASASDSSALTTTAYWTKLYLPVILKNH